MHTQQDDEVVVTMSMEHPSVDIQHCRSNHSGADVSIISSSVHVSASESRCMRLVRARSIPTQDTAPLIQRHRSSSQSSAINTKPIASRRKSACYPSEILDAIVSLVLLQPSHTLKYQDSTFTCYHGTFGRRFSCIKNFSLVCWQFRQVALRRLFAVFWASSFGHVHRCLDIPGVMDWIRLVAYTRGGRVHAMANSDLPRMRITSADMWMYAC